MPNARLLIASLLTLWLFSAGVGAQAIDAISEQPLPHPSYPATVHELAIPSEGSLMPGHLYVAAGVGPHPTLLLLHGLPGNEKNLDIAQALRRAGFNVVFFHYRGAWGAQGIYKLSQLDDDVLAVLHYLRDAENAATYRVDTGRLGLLGHSMGGFAALAAGRQDDALQCVGAMSPANLGLDKRALASVESREMDALAAYADQLFMLAGFNGTSVRADLASLPLNEWDLPQFAEGLVGKSILLVVGDSDTVTPEHSNTRPAADAYRAAGVEVAYRVIRGDHSFSDNRLGLTRTVLDWASSHCR